MAKYDKLADLDIDNPIEEICKIAMLIHKENDDSNICHWIQEHTNYEYSTALLLQTIKMIRIEKQIKEGKAL